jgi:hypothetical protein
MERSGSKTAGLAPTSRRPVVVGNGRRLFEDWEGELPLRLVDSKTLGNGVLALTCAGVTATDTADGDTSQTRSGAWATNSSPVGSWDRSLSAPPAAAEAALGVRGSSCVLSRLARPAWR